MKKLVLIILLVFTLSGCQYDKNFNRYIEMAQLFNTRNNYTVYENNNGTISTYEYSDNAIHYVDEENDIYFYVEDGISYAIAYDEDYGLYIRKEENFDDHYFYAYELIERLDKIGGYVNSGELVWKKGEFYGDEFSGSYIYKEKLHKPLEIRIEIKNNLLVHLYEKYESDGQICIDEIEVSNYGTNNISLPYNVFDYSEIEKLLDENIQEEILVDVPEE